MKCKFVVDVGVDVAALSEADKRMVKWRPVKNAATGKPRVEAYFPAGTEYATPHAAMFVDRGMALPADAECEAACVQLTPETRRKLELAYQADEAGITDPDDREMFFAGVIAGYEIVQGRTAYRPGPNYAAWKEAQDRIKATSPDDDL